MEPKISIWSITLFMSLALASCEGISPETKRTELITKGAWKCQKMGFLSPQVGYIDVLTTGVCAYQKDDITIFNPDGSGYLKNGSARYDPTEPSSLPFSWAFEKNGGEIYFDHQHFKVSRLTENTLEIYRDEQIGNDNMRYIIDFKH